LTKTPTAVRFAPSPTGRLHVGNIRTALLNWLFARRTGGSFTLRLDDTDTERSTEAFTLGIREDLEWLGLTWDRLVRQSDRIDRYVAAAERLKASGHLYACYETADELERRRKRQQARGKPPVYDRAALKLSSAEQAKLEGEGRKPHWRFHLGEGRSVAWADLIRGEQAIELAALSDPVLVREDGTYLYTFASVVDDMDLAITHVIRGEDHVTNTAVQIALFEALRAAPPAFAHHSLLVGPDGQGLSKRLGSLSIAGLREDGLEAMALASYAATIGTSDPVEPFPDLGALASRFDLAKLSRAPARFDPAELEQMNARLLHSLPFAAVRERLSVLGIRADEAFWLAVRGNLVRLTDALSWWRIITRPITPVIEDQPFCAEAARLLPEEPFGPETWGRWTDALKSVTGHKGRALFHPLRLALTGRETGPELKALLPLIGRKRALERLTASTGADRTGA
jgi:glutamyl-tRNA synthetase